MPEYKILTYDEARALYDAGVREIACSGVSPTAFYGDPTEGMHIVIDAAKNCIWEPFWLDHSEFCSTNILGWAFCVAVE